MNAPRPWLPRLALSLGEPAGIGAQIVAALAASDIAADLIAIGDASLLQRAAAARGISLSIEPDDGQWRTERAPGCIRTIAVPLAAPVVPGQLDARNATYVIATLARAASGCMDGEFDALVTAPVHKGIINDAGIAFTGHTEFFAARARCEVAMLLCISGLRVALATTHLPLALVPAAITAPRILGILRIVYNDLRHRFGIASPHIAVLGLNPHAGEGGHLGREEIDIIAPALEALRAEGMRLDGPMSADTAFVADKRARYDAYLAMYHDQGLPVLKTLGFGAAVNITLGLPFVRTSVDHGTALDIAATASADPSSMIAAAKLALDLIEK